MLASHRVDVFVVEVMNLLRTLDDDDVRNEYDKGEEETARGRKRSILFCFVVRSQFFPGFVVWRLVFNFIVEKNCIAEKIE